MDRHTFVLFGATGDPPRASSSRPSPHELLGDGAEDDDFRVPASADPTGTTQDAGGHRRDPDRRGVDPADARASPRAAASARWRRTTRWYRVFDKMDEMGEAAETASSTSRSRRASTARPSRRSASGLAGVRARADAPAAATATRRVEPARDREAVGHDLASAETLKLVVHRHFPKTTSPHRRSPGKGTVQACSSSASRRVVREPVDRRLVERVEITWPRRWAWRPRGYDDTAAHCVTWANHRRSLHADRDGAADRLRRRCDPVGEDQGPPLDRARTPGGRGRRPVRGRRRARRVPRRRRRGGRQTTETFVARSPRAEPALRRRAVRAPNGKADARA